MQTVTARIRGVAPLMVHNAELMADPLSNWSKAFKKLSGKRNKTEEDYEEMSRMEFTGSLYTGPTGTIGLPERVMDAVLTDGAKVRKMGKKFAPAVFCQVTNGEGIFPLEYDGPKDANKLYDTGNFIDRRPAKVNRNMVMRTRPIFNSWALEFSILVNQNLVETDDVISAIKNAGEKCGMCEMHPKMGRFEIEWAKVDGKKAKV